MMHQFIQLLIIFKIILIYGPTASGKSNFAIKLAKKIKGEIVNADSMQVYKELKIIYKNWIILIITI